MFLIVLLFLVEPEKLKYISYFASAILVFALIIMWTLNFNVVFKHSHSKDWEYYNFDYVAGLVGN